MKGGCLTIVALVTGCATASELRVTPVAIAAAADTINAGRPASLATIDEQHVTIRPDEAVEVITLDHHRFVRKLADLVAMCPPHSADVDHLCELRGIEVVVVGKRRSPSTTGHTVARIAIVTAGVVGAVAVTYCADVCKSPYDDLAIAGGLIEVAGFLAWAWLSSKD